MGRNCADAVNALASFRLSAVAATRSTCALPLALFEPTAAFAAVLPLAGVLPFSADAA